MLEGSTSLNTLAGVSAFEPLNLDEPNAWVGHLPFAFWITAVKKPLTFVELGTHTGNSYFSFCQSVAFHQLPTRTFAIDTWQGDKHAGHYTDEIFTKVQLENQKYSKFSKLLRSTFDEAQVNFPDGSIDLLHIDGLHTYEAVKHDFETWLPKMAPDGIVLLHDTNVHRDDFGVFKLWSEIKSRYQSLELLHSHGLGVIQLGPPNDQVIPKDQQGREDLIKFFAGMSSKALNEFGLNALRVERDALRVERDALRVERDALRVERDALLDSLSWRITNPIRKFIRLFN